MSIIYLSTRLIISKPRGCYGLSGTVVIIVRSRWNLVSALWLCCRSALFCDERVKQEVENATFHIYSVLPRVGIWARRLSFQSIPITDHIPLDRSRRRANPRQIPTKELTIASFSHPFPFTLSAANRITLSTHPLGRADAHLTPSLSAKWD